MHELERYKYELELVKDNKKKTITTAIKDTFIAIIIVILILVFIPIILLLESIDND